MDRSESQWDNDLVAFESEVDRAIVKLMDHTGAEGCCFDVGSPDVGSFTVTVNERKSMDNIVGEKKTFPMNVILWSTSAGILFGFLVAFATLH